MDLFGNLTEGNRPVIHGQNGQMDLFDLTRQMGQKDLYGSLTKGNRADQWSECSDGFLWRSDQGAIELVSGQTVRMDPFGSLAKGNQAGQWLAWSDGFL